MAGGRTAFASSALRFVLSPVIKSVARTSALFAAGLPHKSAAAALKPTPNPLCNQERGEEYTTHVEQREGESRSGTQALILLVNMRERRSTHKSVH